MSTTPGDSTWADAGLVPPDGPEDLAEQEADAAELPDDAPEADALEQRRDDGGLPRTAPEPRDDAAEHDLLEQAQDVPDDDADDYPSA